MKSKKGFTLVELLAVIAILAILVLIAIPNVLNLYRNARKNTFKSDVQSILRASEQAYVMNSIDNGNRTCFDGVSNPLDIEARDNLVYVVRLSNKGKITSIEVLDNNYQILVDDSNGITKDEIGKTYEIEDRNKTTDIISCNNSFLVEGEEGSGEENAPYKIQYIEDLVELSEKVNSGETYSGKTIILSRDLDFKNKDSYKDKENTELYTQLTTGTGFIPIGLNKSFRGTFDGRNHRIDNLYINRTEENSGAAAFISVLINGEVKNLTISGNVETSAKNNVLGGIVGIINNSTVDNCINEVTVTNKTNTYAIGGIVGHSSGNATIKNSINKANITGGAYIGGITAANQGGTLTIENCKNYGTITNELGTVAAGLVGQDTINDTKTIIKNSTNYGEIISTNTSNTALYLGGLIGRSTKELEITNSSNEGSISSNNLYDNILAVGGLVGYISNSDTNVNKIVNSYNKGKISGGNRTGGIIGKVDNKSVVLVDRCYNSGNVKNTIENERIHQIASGLIGRAVGNSDTVLINSYNTGEVHSNRWSFGLSINEENSKMQIINSYNIGNIISNNGTSSGISRVWKYDGGSTQANQTINNLYNYGTLNGNTKLEILSTGGGPTEIISINNAYYVDRGIKASDSEINAIPLTENQLLNKEKYNDKLFVDILNDNVKNIELSDINSSFGTLTLCNWKKSTSGYPELDCK